MKKPKTRLTDDPQEIADALNGEPTGIFFYNAAPPIFTECDPIASRLSQKELSDLRARAANGDSAREQRDKLANLLNRAAPFVADYCPVEDEERPALERFQSEIQSTLAALAKEQGK